MDEQFKKILVQFLQLMLDGIQKGAEIAGQQIPLVLQEKLRYDFAAYCIWGGFWLLVIAVVWALAWLLIFKYSEVGRDRKEAKAFMFPAASIITFFALIFAVWELQYALEIWIAPRVYILEWLKGMIK